MFVFETQGLVEIIVGEIIVKSTYGCYSNYTVKGRRFEETNTPIFLNLNLSIDVNMIRRRVKTVSLKYPRVSGQARNARIEKFELDEGFQP